VTILGDTADEALSRASSLKARWLEDSSTTQWRVVSGSARGENDRGP